MPDQYERAGKKKKSDKVRKTRKTALWVEIAGLIVRILNIFNIAGHLGLLVRSEARHAAAGIRQLALLYVMLAVLLLSVWTCAEVLVYQWLGALGWTLNQTVLVLFMINLLLVTIILFLISRTRRSLSFPATRNLLKRLAGRE